MSSDEHKDNERASAPGKPGLSRRSFLSRVGAAGIAATASPLMATVVAEQIGREQGRGCSRRNLRNHVEGERDRAQTQS